MDNGFTLDGTTVLADIGTTVRFHAINSSTNNIVRTGYKVSAAFQYVLSYITNNQITFDSDFFEVDPASIEGYDFVFTGTFVVGNTITITFDNYYGETITQTAVFNTDQATTLADLNESLITHFNLGASFGLNEVVAVWDNQQFSYAEDNGTDTVSVENWIPFTNLTCVVTGGASQPTCLITKTATYTSGMRDLAIISGNELYNAAAGSGGGNPQFISLKDLVNGAKTYFNTTFTLTQIAGVNTFEIEPTIDFFDTITPSVTIPNIDNASYTFTKAFVQNSISVGQTASSQQRFKPYLPDKWDVGNCVGENLNLTSKIIADPVIIHYTATNVNTDNYSDADLYFVQTTDATVEFTDAINAFFFNDFGGGVVQNRGFYNPHLCDVSKLTYWFFNIDGNMRSVNQEMEFTPFTKLITNTATTNIIKLYEFDAPLTRTEFNAIRNDKNKFITFTTQDGSTAATKNGWIKSVVYNVQTGLTSFKLFTE